MANKTYKSVVVRRVNETNYTLHYSQTDRCWEWKDADKIWNILLPTAENIFVNMPVWEEYEEALAEVTYPLTGIMIFTATVTTPPSTSAPELTTERKVFFNYCIEHTWLPKVEWLPREHSFNYENRTIEWFTTNAELKSIQRGDTNHYVSFPDTKENFDLNTFIWLDNGIEYLDGPMSYRKEDGTVMMRRYGSDDEPHWPVTYTSANPNIPLRQERPTFSSMIDWLVRNYKFNITQK